MNNSHFEHNALCPLQRCKSSISYKDLHQSGNPDCLYLHFDFIDPDIGKINLQKNLFSSYFWTSILALKLERILLVCKTKN